MHHAILLAGFLGAWLLVAGPIYQAVLELNEEDVEVARLRDKMASAPQSAPPPSRWWWLLPPVAWLLRRRYRGRVRRAVVDSLSAREHAVLTAFVNKARGWMLVGLGGLLIAVKETFELVEGFAWASWLFWVLVVVMALASLLNTVLSVRHDHHERVERAGP